MSFPYFRQTKLLHALFCQLIATGALWPLRLATFGEWATFSVTLFTLYTVGLVTDTHLQQAKNIRAEDMTA